MVTVREAILVEGRYDKNTLSQIVSAHIIEAGGFGVLNDKEKLRFLRAVAEKRGLIIFTDSDGAGFLIRNRLKSLLPPEKLLHAYIPDIPGKEKRKKERSKEGLLGVEGMTSDIILEALRRSGAHFTDEAELSAAPEPITRQDLYALGLMGGEESAARRDRLKMQLSLPKHLGTGAFLDALNLMIDLPELTRLISGEHEGADAP